MPKRKLYVGCALHNASEESVAEVKRLREDLEEYFDVLRFLFPHPGTDEDVYNLDIHNHVANCDVMLAICNSPSTGLGYELGTAIEVHRKPVLIVSEDLSKVSRLVRGAKRSNVKLLQYSSVEEIRSYILEFASENF